MSLLNSDVFRQIVMSFNHARRDNQVALIDLKNRVLRDNIFHRSLENGTFLACYQVALIDHRLVLGLVGLVGRMLRVEKLLLVTVEQLFLLVVDQL